MSVFSSSNQKCSNYFICEQYISENIEQSICRNCESDFGLKLKINEKCKCSECGQEEETCIEEIENERYLCIKCTKDIYYDKEYPNFPIEELKNEYKKDRNNIKWNDYPEIIQYKETEKQIDKLNRQNKEKRILGYENSQSKFKRGHGKCWVNIEGTELWRRAKNSTCTCDFPNEYKCKNYEICGNIHPYDLYGVFGGFCRDCNLWGNHEHFEDGKKFEKSNEGECPICYETTILYKLVNCNHEYCAKCFKECFCSNYGKIEDYPEDPDPFPYEPEKDEDGNIIYDSDGDIKYDPECDFYENMEDEKWKNDNLVQEWYKKVKDLQDFVGGKPAKFGECSLCRQKL